MNQNTCIVTVTSPEYFSGTVVAFHSFLKTNPWFKGELVVLHNQLPTRYQSILTASFERLSLIQVSLELKTKVRELVQEYPRFQGTESRFYGLDVLRIEDFEQILFCDSDILFTDSIRSLFTLEHPLICCGDRIHYSGSGRDTNTYAEVQGTDQKNKTVLYQTFNSGLMVFNKSLMSGSEYHDALEHLAPEHWKDVIAWNTDQLVFNRMFAERQHLVGPKFNYLLTCIELLSNKHGATLEDAAVMHFVGPAKPWLMDWVWHTGRNDHRFASAARRWSQAFFDCLDTTD